ncbi:riboflavin kinase [Naviculisporaceae sp. PSN 640]
MTSTTSNSATTKGRPSLVGPDTGPEPPFPYRMEGKVISGFGRGSKELGIPTANLPVDADSPSSTTTAWITDIPSGVYFGWASLSLPPTHPDYQPSPLPDSKFQIFPMVMSIGYNPFYKNKVRSAEVHILHRFQEDFYGSEMRIEIMGFIRQEKDYEGLEALVEDINFDCEVARNSLLGGGRKAWFPAVVKEGGEMDCGWLLR